MLLLAPPEVVHSPPNLMTGSEGKRPVQTNSTTVVVKTEILETDAAGIF
jgi:hypothetical protein